MVRTATRVDNLLALNSISKASSLSLRRKSETDFSWIIRCVANASTGKEVTLDFIFLRTFDRISRRRRLCYCSSSLPSSTSSSCFVPIMLLFSRCQPFFACVKRTRWKTQCSQQQTGSFERGIFSPSRWNYCMCWEIVQTAAKHIADMWQKKSEIKRKTQHCSERTNERERTFSLFQLLCAREMCVRLREADAAMTNSYTSYKLNDELELICIEHWIHFSFTCIFNCSSVRA